MEFMQELSDSSSSLFANLSTSLSNHIKQTLVAQNLTANDTDVLILRFRPGSVLAHTLIRERSVEPGHTAATLRENLTAIVEWPAFVFNNETYNVTVNKTLVFDTCETDDVCDVVSTVCIFNNSTENSTCQCRPGYEPLEPPSRYRCRQVQTTVTITETTIGLTSSTSMDVTSAPTSDTTTRITTETSDTATRPSNSPSSAPPSSSKTSPTTNATQPTLVTPTETPNELGLSVGVIVGIVFGVFFAIIIITGILYYVFWGR
ncbi:hypothetical protein RvY_13523-2 [Ramazzottius varieornatus]|nr:hypothetical protein RvY_13523-2 [Ramazzottius varieornatus]